MPVATRLTDEDVALIAELYEEGEGVRRLSVRFQVNEKRIRAALHEQGVEIRKGGGNVNGTKGPWEASEEACLQWLEQHGFR